VFAAVTENAIVGTSVTPLVARSRLALASAAADIQAIAGGRIVLGVGGSTRRMNLEFFPWSNVCATGSSWSRRPVTRTAACVIDIWHIERVGRSPEELARTPLDRIVGVELNAAAATVVGSLYEDTVHRRGYCGEGELDLENVVAALRAAGWTGPWGVEILSEGHRALDVRTAAARAFNSGRDLLDRAPATL
jgi:sugar phosphate isomerase/epimerase